MEFMNFNNDWPHKISPVVNRGIFTIEKTNKCLTRLNNLFNMKEFMSGINKPGQSPKAGVAVDLRREPLTDI